MHRAPLNFTLIAICEVYQAKVHFETSALFQSDLKLGMSNEILMFVEDAKLIRVTRTKMDCEALQMGLSKVRELALKWRMRFNISKYNMNLIEQKS